MIDHYFNVQLLIQSSIFVPMPNYCSNKNQFSFQCPIVAPIKINFHSSNSRPSLASPKLIAAMSLLRSRLFNFYNRVARNDLLTLFSCNTEFKDLEVSIILQNAQIISPHIKYQAACVLEILTGQRPTFDEIQVENEFLVDRDSIKTPEMIRKVITQAGRTLTTEELKLITDTKGFRLKCNLNRVNLWSFLEKTREYYLPNLASIDHEERERVTGEKMTAYFKKPASQGKAEKPREKLEEGENPSVACAAYTLKSNDLLKFPDIELFFEPLHSVLGTGGNTDGLSTNTLQLFIRPTIRVKKAFEMKFQQHFKELGELNNLKIMNYYLSLFFNPYAPRSTQ